jgi:hypothetical protein
MMCCRFWAEAVKSMSQGHHHRPPPSAKESNCAVRTPFEPGCVLHERGRIAACRRVTAEGDPCGEREEVLRSPATSTRNWRRGLFLKP